MHALICLIHSIPESALHILIYLAFTNPFIILSFASMKKRKMGIKYVWTSGFFSCGCLASMLHQCRKACIKVAGSKVCCCCWKTPAGVLHLKSITRCTLKAVRVSGMARADAAVRVHLGSLCIPPCDRLNMKTYADLNERVFLVSWSLVCIYGLVRFWGCACGKLLRCEKSSNSLRCSGSVRTSLGFILPPLSCADKSC